MSDNELGLLFIKFYDSVRYFEHIERKQRKKLKRHAGPYTHIYYCSTKQQKKNSNNNIFITTSSFLLCVSLSVVVAAGVVTSTRT